MRNKKLIIIGTFLTTILFSSCLSETAKDETVIGGKEKLRRSLQNQKAR